MTTSTLDRPKVLVVDDEKSQLEVLRRWLSHSGYEPVMASSGLEALALVQTEQFDVVITDLHMPGLSGLQLLTVFQELDPTLPVVFLSGQGTMDDAIEALREGRAFDFLRKPLRELSKLNIVIEKARAQRAARGGRTAMNAGPRAALPAHVKLLTPQELEILGLLAKGLENRQIAERMCFSEKTIRNYLSRIYEKLGVSNRLQAVAFCQQHGLLEE